MAAARTSRRRAAVSYAETDEHTLSDGSDSFAGSPLPSPPPPSRSGPARSSKHVTTGQQHEDADVRVAKRTASSQPKRRPTSKRSRALAVPRPQQRPQQQKAAPKRILTDGVTPSWDLLPYEVLLTIFEYAAYPLMDEHQNNTPAASWLCRASLTCKAFTDPVLAVLYRCPPIDNPTSGIMLLNLLKSGQPTWLDYKVKIKEIDIDAKQVLAYTASGKLGYFDVSELVVQLPNLTVMHLRSSVYRVPFKAPLQPSQARPWKYKSDLFAQTADTGCRLSSWTWCGNMIRERERYPVELMTQPKGLFSGLRHITLAGITIMKQHTPGNIGDHWPGNCLSQLHQLRSLELIDCVSTEWEVTGTEMSPSWDFLSELHVPLTSLTITDCLDITSSTLTPWLASHGRSLRSLILNHNDSLDLDFLPTLKESCPSLTVLSADLTYYSPSTVMNEAADPKYPTLLSDNAIPTWPSTLQHLTLLHLRRWSTPTALNFLRSLTSSAGSLPDLRHLELKVMLPEASWRERATIREKWTEKLTAVFLRHITPPNPHLASKKAWRLWQAEQDELDDTPLAHVARRRAATKRKHEDEPEESTTTTTRSQARSRARAKQEEEDILQEDDSEQVIHGMCEVVDVTLDNLRPSETRFVEADFLDEVQAGDEEWDEDEDDLEGPEGRVYHDWR